MEPILADDGLLKGLSSPTRRTLLRSLHQRRKTLSELAREHRLSVSCVKKHLLVLANAGLIRKCDDGRKWKYYELTRTSLGILNEGSVVVKLALLLPLLLLAASVATVPIPAGRPAGLWGIPDPGSPADTSEPPLNETVPEPLPAPPEQPGSTGPQDEAAPQGGAEPDAASLRSGIAVAAFGQAGGPAPPRFRAATTITITPEALLELVFSAEQEARAFRAGESPLFVLLPAGPGRGARAAVAAADQDAGALAAGQGQTREPIAPVAPVAGQDRTSGEPAPPAPVLPGQVRSR